MKHFIFSALVTVLVPAHLWAEQSPDMIKGTIGDLEIALPIWSDQSDFYGEGNSGGVSILTKHAAPDQGLGSVGIGFEGSDFQSGTFSNFEISVGEIAEGGDRSEYHATLDDGLQIDINRAEKTDGVLSVSGTVRGNLTWRKLMPVSERAEDPSRQLPVDLEFDAVLVNEN